MKNTLDPTNQIISDLSNTLPNNSEILRFTGRSIAGDIAKGFGKVEQCVSFCSTARGRGPWAHSTPEGGRKSTTSHCSDGNSK